MDLSRFKLRTMWAVWSVVAVLSIFETVLAQHLNETAQNQTDHDIAGSGASFARNLSASISVSDADSALNSSGETHEPVSNGSAIANSSNSGATVEKRENLVEFNKPISSIKASQKLDNFRPSPQLETYFEYNKIPVKPAYPEAKTIPRYGTVTFKEGEGGNPSSRRDVPQEAKEKQRIFPSHSKADNPEGNDREGSPWITKNSIQEDTPWVSRVRFPSGPPSEDRPYGLVPSPEGQNAIKFHQRVQNRPDSFYVSRNQVGFGNKPPYPAGSRFSSNEEPRNRFFSDGPNNGGFDFNKLVEVPNRPFGSHYPPQPNQEAYDNGYNLMEKPSYEIYEKAHEGGYGMSSSWKKILKLLATFIPIGLLISALTPTVLTVTNVNDTSTSNVQSTRYRANDDTKRELHSQILSSLDYFDKLNENGCEYRVFCELLVTARQMPNSEQHVQNLFENLATQDKDYKSRAEELKKVFDAVRNENCNLISCDFINNPP